VRGCAVDDGMNRRKSASARSAPKFVGSFPNHYLTYRDHVGLRFGVPFCADVGLASFVDRQHRGAGRSRAAQRVNKAISLSPGMTASIRSSAT
jgi:hypothetical protein